MAKKLTPPGDDYRIRCPRLGHQIHFGYCRTENHGMPCFKCVDCWYPHFPVEEYLREELTREEWELAFGAPPKPKMWSLIDLIEKAKERPRREDP